jgi:sigma-B regulation protein RsbU (phosphoserine phosphatase)
MNSADTLVLRTQLEDRRRRLETVAARTPPRAELQSLLDEVDSALARMEAGTYGLCETCHDPIEEDRLRADPLLRFCVDHLDPQQLRAFQQDLDLALRIQSTLLPEKNLSPAGWRACYQYQPAGPVGGDYCDLVLTEGGLFFAVGDVAGKGVASSLLMSHLHAIFRSLLSVGMPLPELMERANRVFCESTMPAHYATLVCGRAGAAGEVEICSAGHCRPAVARRGGVSTIDAGGIPLGLFCAASYPTMKVSLDPGDLLVLYTDGVSEARNPAGDEFGEDRILDAAAECRNAADGNAPESILRRLTAFRAGTPAADDLTLMTIQRV